MAGLLNSCQAVGNNGGVVVNEQESKARLARRLRRDS